MVTFFKILFATADVIDDAHTTFLKEELDDDKEKETLIEELSRGKQAFSWSDEEDCEFGSDKKSSKYNKNKKQRKSSVSPKTNPEKTTKPHAQIV